MRGRDKLGSLDGCVHTAIFKTDNQQGCMYSAWNSAQCYVAAWMGGEFGGECEVAQSCPTLCDPMDCSLPGSSVHRTFQARGLQRVAISFSMGFSWPRDWTQVSHIAGRCFSVWAARGVPLGENGCVCVTESPGCSPETIATLFIHWLHLNTK